MDKIKIGKYFTLKELTGNRPDNIPKTEDLIKLTHLTINILDKIRQQFGTTYINSGYRNFEYNKSVGGKENSQHTKGEAADISFPDNSIIKKVYKWIIENLEYDQIIFEKGKYSEWIHISYKIEGNRKENLIFTGENYEKFENQF
jgi:zinc D-Ala-D-Ala carboxypeptidase